jgi:hypothetical protein
VEQQQMSKAKRVTIPLMDPESIKANQNGWLTDAQRKQATPPRLVGILLFFLYLLPAFLLLFVLLPLHWKQVLPGPSLSDWVDSLGVYIALLGGAGLGAYGLYVLRWYIRARRELAEPAIASSESQVVYNPSIARYQARVPKRKLFGIDGSDEVLLPPGVYRLYYLPIGRRVLSGEWLRPNEPGGPQTEILRALMHANDFTAEDLALNKQGLLSPGQQARLFGKEQTRAQGAPSVHLEMLESHMERSASDNDGRTSYYYIWTRPSLGMEVSERGYYALIPGLRYRVYYVTAPRRLASIEPLLEGSRYFGFSAVQAQPH